VAFQLPGEVAFWLYRSVSNFRPLVRDTSTIWKGKKDMSTQNDSSTKDESQYEVVHIRKTKNVCSLCEDYAQRHAKKPIAVLSCEGACLRGEIARQAANKICYNLMPEKTVRICLGGAFTKDTGQRSLVQNAQRVVAVEGCLIRCASRMMQGVLNDFKPELIIADSLYELDGDLFGVDELPEEQIRAHAEQVAHKITEMIHA
jgi:uncharacterized metal-binding protein